MSLCPNSFQTAEAFLDLSYKINGKKVKHKNEKLEPGKPFSKSDAVLASIKVDRHTDGKGYVLKLSIKATKDIDLTHLELKYNCDLTDQKMNANG
jgi:hypothetical protein